MSAAVDIVAMFARNAPWIVPALQRHGTFGAPGVVVFASTRTTARGNEETRMFYSSESGGTEE